MYDLIWTFPLLIFASIVIGWAAELTASFISTGIALAILAWLQTAPEFAVEAVIAWKLEDNLALANLTGSLRLLLGLGFPMVAFVHWFTSYLKKKSLNKAIKYIELPKSVSVEVLGLFFPLIYFLFILLKGSWNLFDGMILIFLYGFYFWLLNQERKLNLSDESSDEVPEEKGIVAKIEKLNPKLKLFWTLVFFIGGGIILILTAHPFVEALKTAAQTIGISEYVFIQWIAPIASEFPEKVTAFNWARRSSHVHVALVNFVSSIICQWTLMAGLVPILFSISAGEFHPIYFNEFQKTELGLTLAQSALALLLLIDLKIYFYEAFGLFILWLIQFLVSKSRIYIFDLYIVWIFIELFKIYLGYTKPKAISVLKLIFTKKT
jgi:cation:H+ antiporter